jgi:hypothetical protein
MPAQEDLRPREVRRAILELDLSRRDEASRPAIHELEGRRDDAGQALEAAEAPDHAREGDGAERERVDRRWGHALIVRASTGREVLASQRLPPDMA